MVSTSLVALKLASTVEAVVLVKLEVVTAVPCRAKVFAVTVPEMGTLPPPAPSQVGGDISLIVLSSTLNKSPPLIISSGNAESEIETTLEFAVTVPEMARGLEDIPRILLEL